MLIRGFLKQENRDMIMVSASIEDLLLKMRSYQAPVLNKVVNTVAS